MQMGIEPNLSVSLPAILAKIMLVAPPQRYMNDRWLISTCRFMTKKFAKLGTKANKVPVEIHVLKNANQTTFVFRKL